MTDIRQSPHYTTFMKRIGWKVEKVDGTNAFIRPFPLIGSVIKIQRPNNIPSVDSLKKLRKIHRAFSITVEPSISSKHTVVSSKYFKKSNTSYLPTKTIHINLKLSEEKIFSRFSESTRRAVRKSTKNNIVVEKSQDIDAFINLKKKYFFPLGFLFTRDIKPLWQTFFPNHAVLLFAYKNHLTIKPFDYSPLAGIFLLFWKSRAYYWLAGSTKRGNLLRAPTLLVWEALKLSKKKRCKIFDFEGIFDKRFPNQNKNWKGFSRFKKGFGGKEVYYPKAIRF